MALVHGGQLVYARGFGVTSVEDGGLPVTPQTLCRIASTTKLLTGTAIMRLVESGTLALDAPLHTYLPWLRFSRPERGARITLRHLLSHTSGLCTFRHDFASREPGGLAAFVRDVLPGYPLLLPPGIAWLYSNAGFSLAACVAQEVTGTPFWDLMRRLIFAPLEMERTTFDPLVALTYPFAQAYERDEAGAPRVEHGYVQNTAWDPAGGAVSTVLDLVHAAAMFLDQGRYRGRAILSPESVHLMRTPVVRLWTRRDEAYGLALATETYRGLPLLRHNGGGIASYASYFYLVPRHDLGFVLLANGGPPPGLIQDFLDRTFDLPSATPTAPARPLDRAAWARYAGTYLGIYTGLVRVAVEEGRLHLRRNGRDFVLEQRDPHHDNHYLGTAVDGAEEISVGFIPGEAGADTASAQDEIDYVVVEDAPCERVAAVPEVAPDPARWSEFAGTYRLPGGSAMPVPPLTIALDGDTLMLSYLGTTMPCIPLSATEFACDAGLLAFHPSPHGPLLEVWRTLLATRISAP